jgi:oxygen-independent coproporphyrinogen-3 oxidase
LAVLRGVELNADDLLRRDVITQLICNFRLRFADIEARHGIRFAEYFGLELSELPRMADDGLLTLNEEGIQVLPAGRLLIRNICMVFDQYLRVAEQVRFSKVI